MTDTQELGPPATPEKKIIWTIKKSASSQFFFEPIQNLQEQELPEFIKSEVHQMFMQHPKQML